MTVGFVSRLGYRSFGVVAAAVSLVIAFSTSAAAAPPPPQPKPTQCLEEFSNNPNYVGDGWVGARVAGPPPPVHLGGVGDPVDREFSLFCGDELSGVVHVGHEETTGNRHPIPPEDEDSFVACWEEIIRRGVPEPDAAGGRTRFVYEYGTATITDMRVPVVLTGEAIVDNERRFTYTVFAGATRPSNDWVNCATASSRNTA